MKLRSCSLMIIFFAANVYKGQTTEFNNSRLKQKDIHKRHVRPKHIVTRIYPEVEKPVFKIKGRKISETKCLEYFWERNNLASDRTISSWSSISSSVEEVRMFEVGGREALLGEFPHMGALGWETIIGSWIFKCGTSLISHKFTLTAAHCSKIRKDRTLVKSIPEIVRLGENNIIDGYGNGGNPIDADILRIIVHPRYLSPKKYYDIALVEFKSELQFSRNVQPLCLWDRFDTSTLGTVVSSTGWGVVDTATKLTSPTLQTTVMDIINSDHCNRLLRRACNRRWCGVRKHQLCAGKLSGGVDACQGDSGGPLQVTINLPSSGGTIHYLVGITSFGIGCARPNLPGVYTRVSSFIDWIESIVWPNQ